MSVFWTIAKSAVFPIIVVSKNNRYPQFILYGWSFIETQMKKEFSKIAQSCPVYHQPK